MTKEQHLHDTKDPLRELAQRDKRFSAEAFRFLIESLDEAVRLAGKEGAEGTERHVTGQEVLKGLCNCASEHFGPLAADVWRSWGVRSSMDWGRIVFLLVERGLLRRQDEDRIEDFDSDLDFDKLFVDNYRSKLPPFEEANLEDA